MIASSYLECLLLLASSLAIQLTFTPARQASPSSDRPESNRDAVVHESRQRILSSKLLLRLSRYIYWMFTLLEVKEMILPILSKPTIASAQSGLGVLPNGSHNVRGTTSTILFYTAIALVLTGSGIRIACFKSLGPLFTFTHVTYSQHRLVTNGPYSVVRHPSYTGVILARLGSIALLLRPEGIAARCGAMPFAQAVPRLATAGICLTTGYPVVYALRAALVLYIGWSIFECFYLTVRRAPKEDESLRRLFGKEWERYRCRVQFKFVPHVI